MRLFLKADTIRLMMILIFHSDSGVIWKSGCTVSICKQCDSKTSNAANFHNDYRADDKVCTIFNWLRPILNVGLYILAFQTFTVTIILLNKIFAVMMPLNFHSKYTMISKVSCNDEFQMSSFLDD